MNNKITAVEEIEGQYYYIVNDKKYHIDFDFSEKHKQYLIRLFLKKIHLFNFELTESNNSLTMSATITKKEMLIIYADYINNNFNIYIKEGQLYLNL